jgi:hypothetical protein
MNFGLPRYDGRYRKTHLRKLCKKLQESDPKGYGAWRNYMIDWLKEVECQPAAVWANLFEKSRSEDTFTWANPLWLVMYEWDIERMPELVNKPLYGVIASWRLELGR